MMSYVGYFAVIDTEWNWDGKAMSIGTVIADGKTMEPVAARYFVLPATAKKGGVYKYALANSNGTEAVLSTRKASLRNIKALLRDYGVSHIFEYGASVDSGKLPELGEYHWHDITQKAAYKQFNPMIPEDARVAGTGRLKSGYGMESMMQMVTGEPSYHQANNAVVDAMDELKIMQKLGIAAAEYK